MNAVQLNIVQAPESELMKKQTTDVALIAAFAALIAACALAPSIKLGVGVPITLQTFGVLLAGACLGPWRGFLAVVLYLVGGGIGLPIFANGNSGFGVFTAISGGYLLAFPLAAALCGFLVLLNRKRATDFTYVFTAGLLSSLVFIHTLGPLGMHWWGDLPVKAAFDADASFYAGDIIKNIVMALVATAVHRAFPDLLRRVSRPKPDLARVA